MKWNLNHQCYRRYASSSFPDKWDLKYANWIKMPERRNSPHGPAPGKGWALRGSDSEFPHLKAGSGHVTHLLGNGEPEEGKNPSAWYWGIGKVREKPPRLFSWKRIRHVFTRCARPASCWHAEKCAPCPAGPHLLPASSRRAARGISCPWIQVLGYPGLSAPCLHPKALVLG